MITSGAVRATINGEDLILPVMRHSHFFEWMKLLHCNYDKNSVEQGVIDWDGTTEKFVSRAEAMKIAKECNQLLHPDDVLGELYTEDLY